MIRWLLFITLVAALLASAIGVVAQRHDAPAGEGCNVQ